MQEEKKQGSRSWFHRWFVNNQAVTVLLVCLLVSLNVFVLTKISFVFTPVLDFVTIIMLPMILSGLFYYLLKPMVDWLEKLKIPRIWAISLVFLLVAILLVWGLAVFIPYVQEQVTSFVKNVPTYLEKADEITTDLLKDKRFDQFRPQFTEFMESITGQVSSFAASFSGSAVDWVKNILSTTSQIVIAIIIMPFILFYLLKDGAQFGHSLTRVLPVKWRQPTSQVLQDVNNQLSNYVRGQITVAAIVALMFTVLFAMVGLKYGTTLAILAGVLNLVPYLGSFLAMIPALIVALIAGPSMLIKVIIIFIVEQTIEGRFVTPLILGSSLKIHPITILFVLLTAGQMFGIWGVLLGVPVYASVKVVVSAVFSWYKDYSGLYKEQEEAGHDQ